MPMDPRPFKPIALAPALVLIGSALLSVLSGLPGDAQAQDTIVVTADRTLPDLRRGQQAAAEGRLDDAEADLRPLAQQRYLEAQIALGKLYARIGTPQRIDEAIVWLRRASERAPQATQVTLGRLLARSVSAADRADAAALLERAYHDREDPDALAGLLRLYTQYPSSDTQARAETLAARAERLATPDTLSAAAGWYRQSPQIGGNDERLLQLCRRAAAAVAECHLDLARDARRRRDAAALQQHVDAAIAAYDRQQMSAVGIASLARWLVDDRPESAAEPVAAVDVRVSDIDEDEGERALRDASAASVGSGNAAACSGPALPAAVPVASNAGEGAAADAAAPAEPALASRIVERLLRDDGLPGVLASGVIARYPYLLPDADIEATLKRGSEAGIAEARLYLGTLYLQGARAPRDPALTLRYLEQAASDPQTAVQAHYFLGRLYQYGYLDESSPRRAAEHLLAAARADYPSADSALARLLSGGKALCPNLVDAYVFARLAVDGGIVDSRPLLVSITQALDPSQRERAEQRWQAERDARRQRVGIAASSPAANPNPEGT